MGPGPEGGGALAAGGRRGSEVTAGRGRANAAGSAHSGVSEVVFKLQNINAHTAHTLNVNLQNFVPDEEVCPCFLNTLMNHPPCLSLVQPLSSQGRAAALQSGSDESAASEGRRRRGLSVPL